MNIKNENIDEIPHSIVVNCVFKLKERPILSIKKRYPVALSLN